MSLGVMAGYAVAYPSNVWMVARQLKHGLMTERKPGSKFDLAHDQEESEHAHAWARASTKPKAGMPVADLR
jgi:hypothetical protein